MNGAILAALAAFVAVLLVSRLLAARARVSGEAARELVQAGAALIDVRTPGEFSMGHLPGARNLPLGELSRRMTELSKDQPVVVYCASGARSAMARRSLIRAGFDAHDLGPQRAWPG